MTTIELLSNYEKDSILPLIKSAIQSEIVKYKLALNMAEKRLKPYEEKYQVSSEYFIHNMAAEDLEGKDEEYVNWAGEYKLKLRLLEKSQKISDINYVN